MLAIESAGIIMVGPFLRDLAGNDAEEEKAIFKGEEAFLLRSAKFPSQTVLRICLPRLVSHPDVVRALELEARPRVTPHPSRVGIHTGQLVALLKYGILIHHSTKPKRS